MSQRVFIFLGGKHFQDVLGMRNGFKLSSLKLGSSNQNKRMNYTSVTEHKPPEHLSFPIMSLILKAVVP